MNKENADKIKALLPDCWKVELRPYSSMEYHVKYGLLSIDDNPQNYGWRQYDFQITGIPERSRLFNLEDTEKAIKEYIEIAENMISWFTEFLIKHKGII